MGTVINNVISPALSACWSWFESLWNAIPGALGFFLALFTFYCVVRLLIVPLLGSSLRGTATPEERGKSKSNEVWMDM